MVIRLCGKNILIVEKVQNKTCFVLYPVEDILGVGHAGIVVSGEEYIKCSDLTEREVLKVLVLVEEYYSVGI